MQVKNARGARRAALALLAFCMLPIALVGCQQGALPGQSNGNTQIQIVTPNPGQRTPTPTFPPFTVGTWPSNFSPNNQDTITIYVLCRVQPASMAGPGTPAPGLAVQVQVLDPINQSYQGTTDNDGMAAITFPINDSHSGTPVVVNVSVTYNGQTYVAHTFFTPNPGATPTPTSKAKASPTP